MALWGVPTLVNTTTTVDWLRFKVTEVYRLSKEITYLTLPHLHKPRFPDSAQYTEDDSAQYTEDDSELQCKPYCAVQGAAGSGGAV